jgi:hypothetical protein
MMRKVIREQERHREGGIEPELAGDDVAAQVVGFDSDPQLNLTSANTCSASGLVGDDREALRVGDRDPVLGERADRAADDGG